MLMIWKQLLAVAFLIVPSSTLVHGEDAPTIVSTDAAPFLGCWADEAKQVYLRFEKNRITIFDSKKNSLQMFRAKYESGGIFFNIMGYWIPAPVEYKNHSLISKGRSGSKVLKKMSQVPAELNVLPLKLGETKIVPPKASKSIQNELAKRFKEDQAARRTTDKQGNRKKIDLEKMHKIDTGNTAYILGVVSKYGWIDTGRFGNHASIAAWTIVQHSGHLPLMLAVLPEVKKTIKNKDATETTVEFANNAKSYAMLYDRVKIMMGEKQRFGTQMGRNKNGETVILALEDKEKVDQFRKEVGLATIMPGLRATAKHNLKQAIKIEED